MADTGMGVGGRIVLASGSFVAGASEKISFKAAGATFVFQFTENPLGMTTANVEFMSSSNITVSFNNFSNPLGTAWSNVIGSYQSRPLHLAVLVHYVGRDLDQAQRVVNYTLSRSV
jgi:hypothetical protein